MVIDSTLTAIATLMELHFSRDMVNLVAENLKVNLYHEIRESPKPINTYSVKDVSLFLLRICHKRGIVLELCSICLDYTRNEQFRDLALVYSRKTHLQAHSAVLDKLFPEQPKPVRPIKEPVKRNSKGTPLPIPKPNLKQLTKNIVKCFDLGELALLCLSLDVRYDQIAGDTIDLKAHNLVLYFERRFEVDRLIDECKKERPKADWDVYE